MNSIIIGLILYLIVVLVIGFYSVRKNKTHADFLLADRKLGHWAISLSERASAESAWLLVGLPGAALAVGFLEIWTVFGCLTGIIFSWLFIAKPLRDLAGKYNSLTLPDLLANYFQDQGKAIRLIASLIITFFFTFYVAAQFNGAGKVINVTFGLPHLHGMIIGAVIILIYTILGGFNAVVLTDMFQAFIMFTTLVLLPVVGLIEISTASPADLHQIDPSRLSFIGDEVGVAALFAVLSGLSWAFGYTGQPHLLARFMAINKSTAIKQGRRIAFCWAIPAFFGAFFLGIIGIKLFGAQHFVDREMIMPFMATYLLPGWIAGILISGAMAAMMSTADSQLLVTSSAIAEDLYHQVGGRKLSPQRMLQVSRMATIIVGALAFILALTSQELVFTLVSYAWSGLGASFGPVLLCIIYWHKITQAGAIAGMLTGAITTVCWRSIPILQAFVAERFTSYIFAFTAIIIVSLGTRPKKEK